MPRNLPSENAAAAINSNKQRSKSCLCFENMFVLYSVSLFVDLRLEIHIFVLVKGHNCGVGRTDRLSGLLSH